LQTRARQAANGLCVPNSRFAMLYASSFVRLDRRDLVSINVTANPTAEWVDVQ